MKISLLLIIFFVFSTSLAVACYKPEPSVIPTIEPTIMPTLEVTIEPLITPTGGEPSITMEPTPTAGQSAVESRSDGKSDGRSDGLNSCPSCTQTPKYPSSPPATGRVE